MKTLFVLGMTVLTFTTGCSKSLIGGEGTGGNLSSSGGTAGSAAVSCGTGQTPINGSCVCPGTSHFDGSSCVSCAANQLWNTTALGCDNTCSVGSYTTSSGSCATCPAGQAWDGTQCVSTSGPTGLPAQVCNSYQQLTSPFVVPARTGNNDCFYVKLSNAVANQPSANFTARDLNVWARDHDNPGSLNPKNPHIIGSSATSAGAVADVQFVLEGPRQVALAANTSGSQQAYVDNFILLEIGMNGTTSYLGSGSQDSVTTSNSSIANDTGYINVNGMELTNYLVGSANGVANFVQTDLESQLQFNTPIDFKSEALDCGITGEVSDIYLVFR